MGNLFTYSGLATKVKAMKRNLLKPSQYQELASMDSVNSAVEYLKKQPVYRDIFTGADTGNLHRAAIEEFLLQAEYHDFSKLYRFSNLSQRKFLDMYFMHYEITILKRCLRSIMGKQPLDIRLLRFQEFFEHHSRLNLMKLSSSRTLSEFAENLTYTPYGPVFRKLSRQEHMTLFDCEMSLDFLYFRTMWKIKDKWTSKNEQTVLTECFGSRLDMLNLQWIYRCIRYYSMSEEEISSLLIPISYRLKPEQAKALSGTVSAEEFFSVLETTYYGNLKLADFHQQPSPEKLSRQVLERIHQLTVLRDPYSIASVNSYLYFKELEIHQIITVIESIRYEFNPNQIISRLENVM